MESKIDVAIARIDAVSEDVRDIKIQLQSRYVTKDEFDPIKKLVYGVVGVVMTGVMSALLALVVTK